MRIRHRLSLRVGIAALAVIGGPMRARGQNVEELQRELKEIKAQLGEMKDRLKKQEVLIEKLTEKQAPAAAVAAPAAAPTVEEQKAEERVTQNVIRKIQPSLSAANKTFPSQFNPAIGLIIDTVASYQENERANFDFRTAELGVSASVDPFARGYAIFNFGPDEVEVEEAALVTTSLPYNLTVKGGRFFADFGRLSKFHDHDLPFVNRPVVLDRFVNGESQGDGVEVSYLTPLAQYLTFTLGAYNKVGGENQREDNTVPRDLDRFTYLARPATFFSLTDANSIDLGASYAYTPEVPTFTEDDEEILRNGGSRHLAGLDLTYRYTPLSQASYRGLVWGTEFLYNHEHWNVGDEETPVFRGKDAFGLYSYLEARLTRRYSPGFLFDWAQALDRQDDDTRAYSPYFTIWLSEFQRIRLQYTYLDEPGNHESEFFLQWTGVLGSHVHGFRDR